MTDAAARLDIIETEIRALREMLRSAPTAATSSDPPVTIAVCEAAWLSGMSESQVRRDCAANPYTDQAGFGIKIGGRWRVAKYRYLDARLRV
jgi:hypothetical protein